MKTSKNILSEEKKPGLHPRNKHASRYDFEALSSCLPELKTFVSKNKFHDLSIDFSNPLAVMALNRAILKFFYHVDSWNIPANYLCPPIPGRADYIHRIADLLASYNNGIVPDGEKIRMLDIGMGANCIYPIIATHEYGWSIVGSDIDPVAISNAQKIINDNKLDTKITLRPQSDSSSYFKGIIKENEFFDVTISNPPFHTSEEEANTAANKKTQNLNKHKGLAQKKTDKAVRNFGGQNNELWCLGGEAVFIAGLIKESVQFKNNCFWFTTLVSKSTTLPLIYDELKKANVQDFKTIDMAQGQKKSRIVAWSYFTPSQQNNWRHLLHKN